MKRNPSFSPSVWGSLLIPQPGLTVSQYATQGALTIFLLFCQLLYLQRKRGLRTQTQALAAAKETNPFHRQED